MKYPTKLVRGSLIKRYKRFLADVKLEDNSVVIAHCTNSGSMKSCLEDNAPVYLSRASDPNRKTKFTWEMIYINNNWIGINTMMPNKLVYDEVVNKELPGLDDYSIVKREVKYGDSRFDIYCENEREKCFIEIKNVTMKVGKAALFPDAVTTRGKKHLETLIEVKRNGIRAVMIYIVQRMDVDYMGPATEIDPDYADALKRAKTAGVEIMAFQAKVSPTEIKIEKQIPVKMHSV